MRRFALLVLISCFLQPSVSAGYNVLLRLTRSECSQYKLVVIAKLTGGPHFQSHDAQDYHVYSPETGLETLGCAVVGKEYQR